MERGLPSCEIGPTKATGACVLFASPRITRGFTSFGMLSSSPTTGTSYASAPARKTSRHSMNAPPLSSSSNTVQKRTSWRAGARSSSARPHSSTPRSRPSRFRQPSDSTASEGGDSDEDQEPPAPVPGMYWMRPQTFGNRPPRALRAHTMTLVPGDYSIGSVPASMSASVGAGGMTSSALLYIFGGCDARSCFNELYIFDPDTMVWSCPTTTGPVPAPRRAHSATFVASQCLIYVFGGGDGPAYFNDLYTLNTRTLAWTKPMLPATSPSDAAPITPGPRRAHTACLWRRGIYVFGGGDGVRALNDVYRLDVADPTKVQWQKIETHGKPPQARGYHTGALVGSRWVIYGGSDGHECFSDCHILDLTSLTWMNIQLDTSIPRLSHTATQIGSYLFVFGGHDGSRYSSDLILLNLVTMSWELRKVYCRAPPQQRGYHCAVLYDSRLLVFGGYDGSVVFDDLWALELSAAAYLPQITSFDIHVHTEAEQLDSVQHTGDRKRKISEPILMDSAQRMDDGGFAADTSAVGSFAEAEDTMNGESGQVMVDAS